MPGRKDYVGSRRHLSTMSPSLLVVPVDPVPPPSVVDAFAARIGHAFGREVTVTDPVPAPSASRLEGHRCLVAGPVRSAIAARWGCGCRDRLVGVTTAEIADAEGEAPAGCGGVVLVSLAGTGGDVLADAVRAVGRGLGLGACTAPDCAMHPRGQAPELCRACREKC